MATVTAARMTTPPLATPASTQQMNLLLYTAHWGVAMASALALDNVSVTQDGKGIPFVQSFPVTTGAVDTALASAPTAAHVTRGTPQIVSLVHAPSSAVLMAALMALVYRLRVEDYPLVSATPDLLGQTVPKLLPRLVH